MEFIETNWLRPHRSAITGEMIVRLYETYKIPILATLVILGAETSLGDRTGQGGPLAELNNFGCIKASATGPWDKTANGIATVRDTAWWTWGDAATGMDAWGQYLSTRHDGLYMKCIAAGDYRGLAAVYYGEDVAGYEAYVSGILERVKHIRAKAADAGMVW